MMVTPAEFLLPMPSPPFVVYTSFYEVFRSSKFIPVWTIGYNGFLLMIFINRYSRSLLHRALKQCLAMWHRSFSGRYAYPHVGCRRVPLPLSSHWPDWRQNQSCGMRLIGSPDFSPPDSLRLRSALPWRGILAATKFFFVWRFASSKRISPKWVVFDPRLWCQPHLEKNTRAHWKYEAYLWNWLLCSSQKHVNPLSF